MKDRYISLVCALAEDNATMSLNPRWREDLLEGVRRIKALAHEQEEADRHRDEVSQQAYEDALNWGQPTG